MKRKGEAYASETGCCLHLIKEGNLKKNKVTLRRLIGVNNPNLPLGLLLSFQEESNWDSNRATGNIRGVVNFWPHSSPILPIPEFLGWCSAMRNMEAQRIFCKYKFTAKIFFC